MKVLLLSLLLATAVIASKNAMLMRVKDTEVTDTQTKVNPDGSKVSIHFAQHKDSQTGNTVYYKKIVEDAKIGQQGYNPEVFFRYAPNEEWRLLPKGCPAPDIKPKENNDKCELGWKIGKMIATNVVFLGLRKGEDDTTAQVPTGTYTAAGAQTQVSEKTRQVIVDAASKLASGMQECLKRNLAKTGFTVEKVCLHKGVVAESTTLINSLKEHAEDPHYKCDYATLRDNSRCMPIALTNGRGTLGH